MKWGSTTGRGIADRARELAARLIGIALAGVAIFVLFAVPELSLEHTLGRSRPVIGHLLAVLLGLAALGFTYKYGRALHAVVSKISRLLAAKPPAWLLLCLGLGLALRIAWLYSFPAPLHADGLVYYQLAVRLVLHHDYISYRGELAYWPPGYPFILYAGLKLFGIHTWVVNVVNLILFSVGVVAVYALARNLADEQAARLSALLLAVWPDYIACTGLGSKEMVLVPFLVISLFLYFRARKRTGLRRASLCLTAGIVLGIATLAHPSFLLFPLVLVVYELLGAGTAHAPFKLALLLVGMGAVIAPWTMRNHAKLGHWVLISDNGGDVFYRANNNLASGGYIPPGGRALPADEIQRNQLGYAWGKQWIASHPAQFVHLAVRKLTFLWGDDGEGIYESMKRGLGISGWTYALMRAIADAFWVFLWMLILSLLGTQRYSPDLRSPEVLAVMLSVLYLLPIHAVFETSARHHLPIIGCLAIVAALPARSNPEIRGRSPARHSAAVGLEMQ